MKHSLDQLIGRVGSFYSGRPVCVTGGAGFIGGHIIDALVRMGARVRVIDDLSNADGLRVRAMAADLSLPLEFVFGSILEPQAMADAIGDDFHGGVVFHLAAMGSVPRSIEDPERAMAVNDTGTLRVLEAARAGEAHRVVFSSSSSVYGERPECSPEEGAKPKVETAPLEPISPYGASKAAAELLMRTWSAAYGLSTASLRYFNVFGPRQRADSQYAAVIPAFVKAVMNDQPPVIFGDGHQTRDFTHVNNVVAANLLAGMSTTPLAGEAMNVGIGQRISISDLAQSIAKACGKPEIKAEHKPERAGDIKHSLASIERAQFLLAYAPLMGLDEGIAETVAWGRAEWGREEAAS